MLQALQHAFFCSLQKFNGRDVYGISRQGAGRIEDAQGIERTADAPGKQGDRQRLGDPSAGGGKPQGVGFRSDIHTLAQ